MINKKEQFLFVVKCSVAFFAAAMLGSFIVCLAKGMESLPIIAIKQWFIMDSFVFVGMLFGATDIIIKIRSIAIRALIVAVVLYAGMLLIMSQLVWNPFESGIKFAATTFLFACAAVAVTMVFVIWQKCQTKKYSQMLEKFKQNNSIE